jgi:uncharacterized protein YjbI with pentapeptide repeats
MTDGGGTCQYVLDPTDGRTCGGDEDGRCYLDDELVPDGEFKTPNDDDTVFDDDGVWRCSHDAVDDTERCIFHLAPEQRPPDADAEAALRTLVGESEAEKSAAREQRIEVIGGRFEGLDLSEMCVGADTDDVFLSHSRIEGSLSLRDAAIESRLRLNGVRVDGQTNLSKATFEDEAHFAGARLGWTDATGAVFERHAIFKNTRWSGAVDFTRTRFEHTTVFTGIETTAITRFSGATFAAGVGFDDSEFRDRLLLNDISLGVATPTPSDATARGVRYGHARGLFMGSLSLGFTGVTCADRVTFEGTNIEGAAVFVGSTFARQPRSRPITFEDATFEATAVFGGKVSTMQDDDPARFDDHVGFESATFADKAWFEGVDFDSGATFSDVSFGTDVVFSEANAEKVVADGLQVDGDFTARALAVRDHLDLRDGTVQGELCLDEAAVGAGLTLESAECAAVSARKADLRDSQLAGIDLSGADFQGADLRESDLESAFLSRAVLSGADLRGARLYGATLGDAQIDDETTFLGHPDGDHDASPHTFSAIFTPFCCVYDPDYGDGGVVDFDKAKSTYRALEELGGKAARPRLQARCFVRRQDLQKDEYRRDVATADTFEKRLIAGARFSRAKVARATLLYGESPWRVIGWSLGSILTFALLFPLGGWIETDDGTALTYSQISTAPTADLFGWLGELLGILGDSVYYSTLTFTALGFGDFHPVGIGRLLTTLETGSGAVLLALLVFILGRRAAR